MRDLSPAPPRLLGDLSTLSQDSYNEGEMALLVSTISFHFVAPFLPLSCKACCSWPAVCSQDGETPLFEPEYRPPGEMVVGHYWLKPGDLHQFFCILALCLERRLRLAIRDHVRPLNRDKFVEFAKSVLKYFGKRISRKDVPLGQLKKVPVNTTSIVGGKATSLSEKLRAHNAFFYELQPGGDVAQVKTSRPVYSRCVLPELLNFLNEEPNLPGFEKLKEHLSTDFYLGMCASW